MPRQLPDYSILEWLKLRPLVDRKNHARYQLRERAALRRFARPIGLPAAQGKNLLVTVAFNDPEVIAWQIALIARHVPDALHVIADNSNQATAAERIRTICDANSVTCIPVPGCPFGTKPQEGGKSHGYALNWTWRNVVVPSQPNMVGFLDHDVFPLEPTDPFRMLDTAVVAGKVRIADSGGRWYLWPGFAFFHLGRLPRTDLNFGRDWLDGFDTGGLNWSVLYRHLREREVFSASVRHHPVAPDVPIQEALYERIDEWLHEANHRTPVSLPPERRHALLALKRQNTMKFLAQAGL